MTRVLAIDTSTWWGSVALIESASRGDTPRIVTELGRRVDDSHAEHVLDWISRCLTEAGWAKSDIDLYAATRGPGSFTGIRVALGTVRGLALASGRPAVGVTTLQAIAEAHGASERERVPVMEAGRGELYAARFDPRESPPDELRAPWLAAAPSVLEDAVATGAVIITGPGTRVELPSDAPDNSVTAAPECLAGAAGRIAAALLDTTDTREPLAPLYIRPPDALLKRPRR